MTLGDTGSYLVVMAFDCLCSEKSKRSNLLDSFPSRLRQSIIQAIMARLSLQTIFGMLVLVTLGAAQAMESHQESKGQGVWGYLNAARTHEPSGEC